MMEQQSLWEFMSLQSDKLVDQILAHTGLTFISLLLALLIGLPLGIFVALRRQYGALVLGFAGVMQTVPSIALLGFMIPILGIGALPAIAALFLYALLPIIRNTSTGIREADATVIEAAKGMGMSKKQILFKVQLPLAMPFILAGIRTATVINVGVATLAAYIAAGGLGEFIFGGIALNNTNMILAGAIPAACLAIFFDFMLSRMQKLTLKRMRVVVLILGAAIVLFSSFYLLPFSKGKLLAGFTPEFMGREDGYLGLRSRYGFEIPTVVISDAVMYKAVFEKKLDVISGYSTDGRLKAFDLVTLLDDQKIFPPYYAAPIVRTEVLDKYPQLEHVLNLLAGTINDSIMTELNYRVDHLHQSPEKVAREFLMAKGLFVKPSGERRQGRIRLGSKIFSEQYILIQMYKMLIEGRTSLMVESKTGLGGTKICYEALINNQIDLYPEYTGTGLLVILKPSAQEIADLAGDRDRVYQYVKAEFKKKKVTWLKPIGFNNAYALMMRRREAEALNLKSISDLKIYLNH